MSVHVNCWVAWIASWPSGVLQSLLVSASRWGILGNACPQAQTVLHPLCTSQTETSQMLWKLLLLSLTSFLPHPLILFFSYFLTWPLNPCGFCLFLKISVLPFKTTWNWHCVCSFLPLQSLKCRYLIVLPIPCLCDLHQMFSKGCCYYQNSFNYEWV